MSNVHTARTLLVFSPVCRASRSVKQRRCVTAVTWRRYVDQTGDIEGGTKQGLAVLIISLWAATALSPVNKKSGGIFWVGSFLDLVTRSGTTHAEGPRGVGCTCGEPNEIEVTAPHGLWYRSL